MNRHITSLMIVVLFLSGCSAIGDINRGLSEKVGAYSPAQKSSLAKSFGSPEPPLPNSLNTEEYDRIYEDGFLDARSNPLSTFAIDVDTASYSNVRRFVERSRLPRKDAVRIEEFVNYFSYGYPDPDDGHPFSVTTEVSTAPWDPTHQLVHIGVQGKRIPKENLPDSNLVFLLDVSGSMSGPDGLPLLKRAFRLLVEQLDENDRVAIVVYAGSAGRVLRSTPGNEKSTVLEAIARLTAGGSTAGGAGIQLAYQIAKDHFIEGGNNRVILATDGDFNVGTSSNAELTRLIESKRDDGVFLTVLGFGRGNYKDSKMEALADTGNGNYSYIDNIMEAKKVLVSELAGTLLTIAKDVKIQVEFNPAKVKAYRLIGYENRRLADEDFADDKKDAGELGAGHSVTALYDVVPAGSSEEVRGTDPLKYQEQRLSPHASESDELVTVTLRYKLPAEDESRPVTYTIPDAPVALEMASEAFRFSAAVAEFGMLLRNSEFKGQSAYGQVLELARAAKGEDRNGYRAEFVRLVETVALLQDGAPE